MPLYFITQSNSDGLSSSSCTGSNHHWAYHHCNWLASYLVHQATRNYRVHQLQQWSAVFSFLVLRCIYHQHQPTPLLVFLRHLNAVLIGAPCTGGNGENGFSRKKWSPKRSPTLFGPCIEGTILDFFLNFCTWKFPITLKNLNFRQMFEFFLKNG